MRVTSARADATHFPSVNRSSAGAGNDVLTFAPNADTYVDSSKPTQAFGSAVSSWVDGSPTKQAFIRFPVTAVTGRTVLAVRLRMRQTDGSPSGGRVWSMTSSAWTESTTWNSRPAIDGALLAAFGPVAGDLWYELGLGTSAVTQDGTVSFALDSTDADGARWASRESNDRPQLIVELAPTDGDRFAFTPEADTYVDASAPSSGYGTAASFWVDGSPVKQSFMRFRIAGLAGRAILAARLRIYQIDASPAGGTVSGVSSTTWSESITWNTRPSIDGSVLGTFPTVSAGAWYEVDLNRVDIFPASGGPVSLALSSTNADGARWESRESVVPPQLILTVARQSGLVVDGLSQVATRYQGSTSPSFYASNHRMALTASGRLLAVFGVHATGPQLVWRDPGGGWQSTSTGSVADGVLEDNGSTGDRPASIAVATDHNGAEHAWAVWSGSGSTPAPVSLRRLSDLDGTEGPSVGPTQVLANGGLGDSRADVAFETAPDGSLRGCVTWTEQTGASTWQVLAAWFTDLTTDTPALTGQAVVLTGTTSSRVSTLVSTAAGMRLVSRPEGGKLQIFGHDRSAPLTTWWAGAKGVTTSSSAYPSATALASGQVLAAIESSTASHVVTVLRYTSDGATASTDLQVTGYAQPTIAADGTNAWLVMVRTSDGFVVSRAFTPGSGWDAADRVEIGAEGGGGYAWPNLVGQTDGRLRLLVRGPSAGPNQFAVLAYQRTL